ncbi:CPBP family intramembrane metalloprotease [Cellulosimicrobium cellulans]|uniref:CPBP family intramembrane glutamic endopeptidase n=1 Tax=Cellulosimicrobium cellulans TaxID=1710 RepID=UPI00196268F9|nr:CPBP family intramembrane glutamic endopeptidase [Cellulosimicrobium cellulans]MBN0039810.1 CPBP family intramembrane metalloprotease [Cellulosimicrobium cellulans]
MWTFLALYIVLTAWISLGTGVVTDSQHALVKNIGYIGLAAYGVWVFREALSASLRMTEASPVAWARWVIAGLVLMGIASGVSALIALAVDGPLTSNNQAAIDAEMLAASSSIRHSLLLLAVGAIFAPLVEEFVFREIPFARLRPWLSTPIALASSCLCFGALHLRSLDEWPLAILYIGFSLALAVAYLGSKRNLLVPIAAHALWNGSGLTFVLLSSG